MRFIAAGSVDDGKSTLIGRLLHDSKAVFEDQLSAIERVSTRRGLESVDLSLLTDGLVAEREQGITIDVAYRYFATPKRRFIIADTPGHEQYTRNMVTGASTADLAIVLVDARKGLQKQSRRHAYLAALLGTRHLLLAVNKMDLVGYRQDVFQRITGEFAAFTKDLELDVIAIPISALEGDMVVERGAHLDWYQDATLLETLESIEIETGRNLHDFRFPVQRVARSASERDFRGYMGRIEAGSVRRGDEIAVLPTGRSTRVREILTYDGKQDAAFAPQSVTLVLAEQLDVSRGDMIVSGDMPRVVKEFEAMVCWMDENPMSLARPYLLKHTTKTVKALPGAVRYRVDVDTLQKDSSAQTFAMNDIGRISIKTVQPLFVDSYARNRQTGNFILIDEATNRTVAAGMIA